MKSYVWEHKDPFEDVIVNLAQAHAFFFGLVVFRTQKVNCLPLLKRTRSIKYSSTLAMYIWINFLPFLKAEEQTA